MRVLVMGAGAVGGYYGGLLARTGHEVTFVARGAHLAALRERGLEIRGGVAPIRISPVRAVASPAEAGSSFDLVLFTVKTYDTDGAISAIRPVVGPETAVLTLQNGVDSVDQLRDAFGAERVLAGATRIISTIAEPGVIAWSPGLRQVALGELTGRKTPRLAAIARAFGDVGAEVSVSDDPLVPVWEKFVLLASHATITSACQLPLGPIREAAEGQALYRALIDEVVAVGRAEGINLPEDVADTTLSFVMRTIPATAKTSLQISFERGQRVELEQITGSVVRRARAAGVAIPAFTSLYAVLKVRALHEGLLGGPGT